MQATKEHISLETAKLLKDCGIKSKMYFLELYDVGLEERYVLNFVEHREVKKQFSAFTWSEILWEYAELFFGIEKKYYDETEYFDNKFEVEKNTGEILNLLQPKKYDEADLYFRENCILIKK